ncbi:MAG: PilZ domain-containing protein [Elusimicrobia bacterium]|nr:PilZ domain-containing protein [Elusimicrobiota bacterium]
MYEDRRKYKRYQALALADISSSRNIVKKDRVSIMDISIGGLSFESSIMFHPGDDIYCNFFPLIMKLKAKVNRVINKKDMYLHGAEFKIESFVDKVTLRNLISSISR